MLALVVIALQQNKVRFGDADKPLTYTQLLSLIEGPTPNVKVAHIHKDILDGEYLHRPATASGDEFTVNLPASPEAQNDLFQKLNAAKVQFDFQRPWLS